MGELAIEGGQPVRTEPFPARVQIGDEELEALTGLVKSYQNGGAFDRYGGEHVDAYEREFADYFGAKYATATSSGTAAIHSALGALHLEVGSEVISSPITDPGAVAPILWSNCIPIFADVDAETFNIDPNSVAERATEKTKAVICGHIAGQPCDMDPIMEIAEAHDLVVIEDCAQAHDAEYKGWKVGTIGQLGAFSLMSGKHSTSGGQGGMVLTDDEELYWDAKRFADRGKPFNSDSPANMFLGMNYRMTELEAVIGRVQLKKLPTIVSKRREFVGKLRELISDLEAVRLGKITDGAVSAYWFLFFYVDETKLRVSKAEFAEAVAAEGIPVTPSYDFLLYEHPWIRDRQTYGQSGCPWVCPFYGKSVDYEGACPNARKAIDTHMRADLHECYTDREAKDMAMALRKVERAYLG